MRQMRASHTGGKVYQDPFKLVCEHQLITGPGPLNLLTRLCYWLCSALDHSMHDNGTPNNRCTCWARPWQNKRWLRTRLSTGTYRCFSVCHDQEWVMFRILILGKLARKTSNCMCHQSLHALTVLKLVSVWTLDRSLACKWDTEVPALSWLQFDLLHDIVVMSFQYLSWVIVVW